MLNILYLWLTTTFLDLFVIKDFDFLLLNWSERFLVNLLLSSFALLSILILFSRVKRWILFLIIALPMLIQATYFEIYRKVVSSFGFQTFFEDWEMVLKLWVENIDLIKSLTLLAIIWFLVGRVRKVHIPKKISIPLGFSLISIYSLIIFSWYSVPNFQNSVIAYYGSLLETVKLTAYHNFKVERPKLSKESRENLPNIIYIVGESFVVSHSSLYGYSRDTTPNLKRLESSGDLIKFNNATAIGTKTRLSVPYMLVGLQGIDPEGKIYSYPTVINYMRSIGYQTHFISSQDLSWGGLKNLLIDRDVDSFVNGTKYNSNARVHKGTDDLIMVEKEILPTIRNSKKPFFIVYQMDGSHYPYSKHSPEEFKKWKEDGENSVNAYDNTLLYSDTVISKIIESMRSKYPDSWVFYSTDHGQNLGGKGGMFNDNFEKDVVHNGFFISAPERYRNSLRSLQNSPVSQADIVPTILDIVDLEAIKPLNGLSLLGKIPEDRLRIASTYMPTLHNTPEATLIFPDLSYIYIDFAKMSATLQDGKSSLPFDKLKEEYRLFFTGQTYNKE
jgi:glucan phosphoethanolaminetransferase (alkaline phosphatase superfamily)